MNAKRHEETFSDNGNILYLDFDGAEGSGARKLR